ncbi:hypothetical protein DAMA08_014490 [Martiniozyma asiatica (nom. inval.)]|nr:hypothetical protein DAMA08_014490 [Martiniozyma asiatica]
MADIKVKSLTGRTLTFTIDLSQRVLDLKELVEVKEGIPPTQQKFLLHGRQLEDSMSLEACGVKDGTEMHLVLSLRGGGR